MKKQVKYRFGNNENFKYFIRELKKDARLEFINSDSLAAKFSKKNEKISVTKFDKKPYGNFDCLLEKVDRETNEPIDTILCNLEDKISVE